MTIRGAVFVIFLSAVVPLQAFAQSDQVVITPDRPSQGDRVTLIYPASGQRAPLGSRSELEGDVLLSVGTPAPVRLTVPMQRGKEGWTGSFVLSDPAVRAFAVRFLSGKKVDDNQENAWIRMVYGSSGPVKGARIDHAGWLTTGSFIDFQVKKNEEEALKLLKEETTEYPGDIGAIVPLWNLRLRRDTGDETRDAVRTEVLETMKRPGLTEGEIATLLPLLERVGEADLAAHVRDSIIARSPSGKVAEARAREALWRSRDVPKRTAAMESYLRSFPQPGEEGRSYRTSLASLYAQAGDVKKIDSLIAAGGLDAMALNAAAWTTIEKGGDVEKAVGWARQGVDRARSPGPTEKPAYLSDRQWEEQKDRQLAMVLDTYGFGLMKLGRFPEAQRAFEEALRLTGVKESDINERAIAAFMKAGDPRTALATAEASIVNGAATDSVLSLYREAYVAVNGSQKGFDEALAGKRSEARKQVNARLAESRIDRDATDFTLPDLNGTRVSLASLRGKVVVLDFWATWCGPCRMSFPYLQKVYDAYRGNDRVAIFAINTWENEKGEERERAVRKFLDDNKYTFPVLFDSDTVEKYGVQGIPTKFVIDRDGKIQFKGIGFEGPVMVDELSAQIEYLLQ